jgi:hypothetical protein
VLGVARALAVAGGLIGFGLTFYFDSVVGAIQLFYQVMIVTLFAPLLGALIFPRSGTLERAHCDARRRGHAGDDAARDGRRGLGMGSAALPGSRGQRDYVLHPRGVLSAGASDAGRQ